MRQQDRLRLREVLRLVLLHPKQLWNGVAGQHRIARQRDHARLAAEMMRDLRALRLRGCIAPQLRRAHGLIVRAERHEAVLLPADADAGDFRFVRAERGQALRHAGVHGVGPRMRMLLQMAGRQAFDQIVG